jgi:formate C-acetyltransferase
MGGHGIYHIQFNVVSPEILKEAQLYPEKHRDLMVRVSEYCAYFVDLPREIQDEIISRTTHKSFLRGKTIGLNEY